MIVNSMYSVVALLLLAALVAAGVAVRSLEARKQRQRTNTQPGFPGDLRNRRDLVPPKSHPRRSW